MLEVNGLDVAYGSVQALWNVSLRVEKGEIVTLIGSNGAGKSTLLKAISGLLKPWAGEIIFDGRPLHLLQPHEIVNLGIAHVPEGRKLWPGISVWENLLMGAYPSAARPKAQANMERVLTLFPKLKSLLKRHCGVLSGGEQQMVAIGRGLMSAPRLLMLDETSLGLAPAVAAEVLDTIRELARQGMTILLVEQNVAYALDVAGRGYVIDNGRITMTGESQALVRNEEIRTIYMGL